PPDVLRDFPGRPARERDPSERAGAGHPEEVPFLQQDRELAGRRDGEQVRAGNAERTGLGAPDAGEENLGRAIAPGGPVDDRVGVCREAGEKRVAAVKRQALVDDGFLGPAGGACTREGSAARPEREGGEGDPDRGEERRRESETPAGRGGRR